MFHENENVILLALHGVESCGNNGITEEYSCFQELSKR